jgi:hypothetical protein
LRDGKASAKTAGPKPSKDSANGNGTGDATPTETRPIRSALPPAKPRKAIPSGEIRPIPKPTAHAANRKSAPAAAKPDSQPPERNPVVLSDARTDLNLDDTQPIRLTNPLDGASRTILPKPRPVPFHDPDKPKPIRLHSTGEEAVSTPPPARVLPKNSAAMGGLSAKVSKLMAGPHAARASDSEDDPFETLLDEDFEIEHLLTPGVRNLRRTEPAPGQGKKSKSSS